MGIAITDDHRELAEVARGFLTSQKARWAARSLLDASDEPRPGFWQNLVELGWLGLHVDEEYAKLAAAIVDNPMLNGQCLRLDAGQRFAPK